MQTLFNFPKITNFPRPCTLFVTNLRYAIFILNLWCPHIPYQFFLATLQHVLIFGNWNLKWNDRSEFLSYENGFRTHHALRLTVPGPFKEQTGAFSWETNKMDQFCFVFNVFTCAQKTRQIFSFLISKALEESAFFESFITSVRQKLAPVALIQISFHLFWNSFLGIFTLTANSRQELWGRFYCGGMIFFCVDAAALAGK